MYTRECLSFVTALSRIGKWTAVSVRYVVTDPGVHLVDVQPPFPPFLPSTPSPRNSHTNTVSYADFVKEEMEAEAKALAATVPVPPGAQTVVAGAPAAQQCPTYGGGPSLSVPTVPQAASIRPPGMCMDSCASSVK
jgi:hypothetical protein